MSSVKIASGTKVLSLSDSKFKVVVSSEQPPAPSSIPSGAAVAYSLRKLYNSYSGPAIRVKRSTDDLESDIGFTSGVLDTAALTSFCGAGNGLIMTWYDQSGNANHATPSAWWSSPVIVKTGSVNTINSKPAIDFNTNLIEQQLGYLNINPFNVGGSFFHTFVGKPHTYGPSQFLSLTDASFEAVFFGRDYDGHFYLQGKTTGHIKSNSSDSSTGPLLLTGIKNSSDQLSMYKNGSQIASSQITWNSPVPSAQISNIGGSLDGQILSNGLLQEIIFFNNLDQTTNRSTIESNINSFYGIY